MALKAWFDQLRPVQLYIMLTLTSLFFAAELTISHLTHSLTLLVDSYHMLCNIIALAGCVITIKKINSEDDLKRKEIKSDDVSKTKPPKEKSQVSEKSLKNTFGWARIDVLVMMIGCIFLASLCFSLLVEAAQTLVHIDHTDEMHYPIVVVIVAGIGLLLNGFCYLLIGGYTFHQGSYFHVTDNGDVILQKCVTADSLRQGQRRLSSQTRRADHVPPVPAPRQGFREMLRDVIGCFYVIICGLVVYLSSGHHLARFFDPIISIFSAISLLILSYPYMKESGLILLQTIPNDIDIELLQKELLKEFPMIKNIHDLHVWQLTIDRVFATAHIMYENPKDYLVINEDITQFFLMKGITHTTIQAEFFPEHHKSSPQPCLMPCLTVECRLRNCCVDDNETEQLTMVTSQSSSNGSCHLPN